MKRIAFIPVILLLFASIARAQYYPSFSLSTGLDLQRSFKKGQQFWAVGHTTMANFHLSKKEGIYVWFSYFSDGKFNDAVTATAKQPATIPQQVPYTNSTRIRFKHFSLGWKHYFKGAPEAEKGWNLYGNAGLGLMLGRVLNTHSVNIDTADYDLPLQPGKANFKRLTLDLGLGVEFPIGNDFFIYGESKVLLPTTDYPSPYIFINDKAPFTASAAVGLRLYF